MASEDDAVTRARRAIDAAGGLTTPSAYAEEIGVTAPTLSKWIKAGKLPEPIYRAGRVKLYLRAQLEALRAPD